jgi:hypothetical protein
VLFRAERGPSFAGHRNRLENNQFVDNAPEDGAVIDIQGATASIVISDNQFNETRGGSARVAVRQGPETKDILIRNNQIKGLKP